MKDITEFVTAKARAATHPVFGKVFNERPVKLPVGKPRRQASDFSIQAQGKPPSQYRTQPNVSAQCNMCRERHWLPRCSKFRRQSLQERQKFVDEKKLCSNCFSAGHFVRECLKESFCKVQGCTGKHSTFLHPKSDPAAEKPKASEDSNTEQTPAVKSYSANNGYVKSDYPPSSTVTGLAIIPVKVKAKGQHGTLETYAFLDSGSNASFCTEDLLEKLELKGTKTKLSLTTLQGENSPTECSLVSLEAYDISEENVVQLPMVYSRPSLPISPDAIANQEDVERWPYLKGIKIPRIEAEIGLLIGSDVPEALQPKETRESQNGGPFATRTTLGWVINGPLDRDKLKVPTANFIQADTTLDQQFQEFCNREFQLHHFSDASRQRYGAVTYLRITDHHGNVKCSFVMGKSRLAPLKPVTIPRMELSAAVVSTRLDNISRKELSLLIDQSFFGLTALVSCATLRTKTSGFKPSLRTESLLFMTHLLHLNGIMSTLIPIQRTTHQEACQRSLANAGYMVQSSLFSQARNDRRDQPT